MTVSEFGFLPSIQEVCRQLKIFGYLIIVITNQPEVSRGNLSIKTLESINSLVYNTLPVDSIKVCIHSDEDKCKCRKPLPQLIYDACEEFNINPRDSWMVGDRWKDIDCGYSAGCKTIFIDYGYDETFHNIPNFIVKDVSDIVEVIKVHDFCFSQR